MRVERAPGVLRLRDRPEAEWILGGFLAAGGAVGLRLCLTQPQGIEPWELALVALIGLGVLAGGLHLIGVSPRTTTTIDAARGRITVASRSIWARRTIVLATGDVVAVDVAEDEDSEGGPVWRLRLGMHDGRCVDLSQLWRHDRPGLEIIAGELRREFGLAVAPRREGR